MNTIFKLLRIAFFLTLMTTVATALSSCNPQGNSQPAGEESAPGPSEAYGSAAQPSDDNRGANNFSDGSGDASESVEEPADRTMAVDVGNPKDTGPQKPKGQVQLRLADAPIDNAQSLVVHIEALEFVTSTGQVERLSLPASDINLLDYQNGQKHLLFEGDIPTGSYQSIRVILADNEPATLTPASGLPTTVSMSSSGVNALAGNISLQVSANQIQDITMHVDLRKSLRIINSVPWLLSTQHTFISQSVGTIHGLGLNILNSKVACVYPSSDNSQSGLSLLPQLTPLLPLPPILPPDISLLSLLKTGSSDCLTAAGSSVINGLEFQVHYLPPGDYNLIIYLTDTLYLEIPGLYQVSAGLETLVDLSELNDLIATLLQLLGL